MRHCTFNCYLTLRKHRLNETRGGSEDRLTMVYQRGQTDRPISRQHGYVSLHTRRPAVLILF